MTMRSVDTFALISGLLVVTVEAVTSAAGELVAA
jgi:hypothetical protein